MSGMLLGTLKKIIMENVKLHKSRKCNEPPKPITKFSIGKILPLSLHQSCAVVIVGGVLN